MNPPGSLDFDIDLAALHSVGAELGASEKQIKFALSRALARTASTLRTYGARALRDELQLRTLSLLRRRLKSMRVQMTQGDGVRLWFGMNDMPVSWFKGTPKKTKDGAQARGQDIAGGFVGRSKLKGRKTIFKRKGGSRLPIVEQNIPIEDAGVRVVEDLVFPQLEDIFWQHFRRDLRARVKFQIGGS